MSAGVAGPRRTLWDQAFLVIVAAIYVFLMFPILLVVVLSFNSGEFLAFPPEGVSLRWFGALFSNQRFLDALIYSLRLASIAMAVNAIIGTLAAIYVSRFAGRWRDRLRTFMTSPLLIPEILTAIALLFYFYGLGIGTDYSLAIQIGHIVITFPYMFLNVSTALFNFDRSQEEAARSLGAGPWMTFRRVTLPTIKPGLITGSLFAFVISFDVFNISLLLKALGKNTMPLELFDYLRFNFDPTAAAIASLSIFITFGAILIVDRTVGLRSLRF